MTEPRKSILIATGCYSLVALTRYVGIAPVKSGAFLYIALLDAAVFATFLTAMLWSYLRRTK